MLPGPRHFLTTLHIYCTPGAHEVATSKYNSHFARKIPWRRELQPHPRISAWETAWTEGGLYSPMGSQRVGTDWATKLTHTGSKCVNMEKLLNQGNRDCVRDEGDQESHRCVVEVAFSLTPKPLQSYLAVNFSIVNLEKFHRWVGKENILKEVGNLYWSCNYSFFKKMGKTGLKVSRLASNFCVICTLQSEKVDCGVNETLLSNLLKSWHFLTVISGCLIFQLQIH